jgi:hypothetical protein
VDPMVRTIQTQVPSPGHGLPHVSSSFLLSYRNLECNGMETFPFVRERFFFFMGCESLTLFSAALGFELRASHLLHHLSHPARGKDLFLNGRIEVPSTMQGTHSPVYFHGGERGDRSPTSPT